MAKVPHVVIVGGGFAGIECAKALGGAFVNVTLIDRTNHHLFQPLLYQVATAGLSPAEIASPIRSILSEHENIRVLLAEVTEVNLHHQTLTLRDGSLSYDYLVLANGADNSYFGHDQWEVHAPGLKTLDDALEIRRRVLYAFERAERESDEEKRRALLTFVVIGGGPTGVEMAGALRELAHFALAKEFRSIDPASTRVVLIEAAEHVLSAFQPELSESAEVQLRELKVELMCKTRVTEINKEGVRWQRNDQSASGLIETQNVVWAAGVRANALNQTLHVELDRMGRVVVNDDCSIPSRDNVFVIGDAAAFRCEDGSFLPGLCPVAMQQGRYIARTIRGDLQAAPRQPFRYTDKGIMATVGRSRAVAQTTHLRLSGFIAWVAWLFVHILYLIGFRNRFVVMFTWAWSYVTFRRGARLITGLNMQQESPAQSSKKSVMDTAPNAVSPQAVERKN